MLRPEAADYQRLRDFNEQVSKQIQSIWQPGQRVATTLIVLLALAVATIGARLLEVTLGSFCLRRLPEGRLRRSAIAISTMLATMVTVPFNWFISGYPSADLVSYPAELHQRTE